MQQPTAGHSTKNEQVLTSKATNSKNHCQRDKTSSLTETCCTETHIQSYGCKVDITTTLTHNCSNKGRHNALSPIQKGFVFVPRKYKYVTTALLYIKPKKLINRLANTKKVVTLQCKTSIGIWCNGNTTDSGPVILGSSPSIPTNKRIFFMEMRLLFFHYTVVKVKRGKGGKVKR